MSASDASKLRKEAKERIARDLFRKPAHELSTHEQKAVANELIRRREEVDEATGYAQDRAK